MPHLFRSVFHPTAFSGARDAFAHALRIALSARGELRLLHVNAPGDAPRFDPFPRVRDTLAQWKLIDPAETEDEVAERLGLRVAKDLIWDANARAGIVDTLQRTPADLLVLSLADRAGVPDLFQDSVAEEVARAARIPSLCVRRGGGGFVSEETGEVTLRSILIPVAPHIACARAVDVVMSLCEQLGCDAPEIHLMRVGSALEPPERAPPRARFQLHAANGPVVEAILDLQAKTGADLVCMPVNRSRGFVAAVRGKIAERVLRSAPCPTLLTPAD